MIGRRPFDGLVKSPRETSFSVVVAGLFCSMFLDAVSFPGLGVPVSSISAGLVILYAFSAPQRLARREVRKVPLWFGAFVLAFPMWLLVTSIASGEPDARRLLNVGVHSVVIFVLAGPRLSIRSVGRGLALAVVLGVIVGASLLPTSEYVGRMTGPLGDPNSAGYLIVVFTALALSAIRRTRYKLGLGTFAVAGVLLTQSRTSMLAMAIMILWVTLSRFVSSWISVPAVAFVLYWISSISESLAGDAFAERAGSDMLRERIYDVELSTVEINPLMGQGAGAAKVDVSGMTFFFHSSYLALRAEAGWIGLIIMISLLGLVFCRLLALPRKHRNYLYEAALIGVAVCAINLGEVLLALPAAFALGLSMRHVVQSTPLNKVKILRRLPAKSMLSVERARG